MLETEHFDRILRIVVNVFDTYSAVLFTPAEGGGVKLASAFSLGDHVQRGAIIGQGVGLVGWIIRNKQPLLVNNFDQKRGILGYYDGKVESQIRAFMGCPLEGVDGCLCLDSKRTYTFSEKDQKILGQFASLISAIYAEHHQDVTVRAQPSDGRRLKALHHLSSLRKKYPKWPVFKRELLATLARAGGFELALLAVRDEGGQAYYVEGATRELFPASTGVPPRFPLGSGLIGYVFKNNQAVGLGEGDHSAPATPLFGRGFEAISYRSVVCLPVSFSKRTRGVLVLANETPISVDPELKIMLETAADYISLFMENLHQRIKLASRTMDKGS